MKTILRGAAAAIAMVSFAGTATANTHEHHYAGHVPILGIPYTATNPTGLALIGAEANILLGAGTRYTADAFSTGDTETATPTVTTTFNLHGSVNKDCSYYAGNNSNAQNIDFGTIGVRTGNNENVGDAFEMVAPASAIINSLTAGCNFNNTVAVAKGHLDGMVNGTTSGYDSNQFQANIPYSVQTSWTGVPVNTVAAGSAQGFTVATNALNGSLQQGAWRSSFNMVVTAPVPPKALVAGTYSDTLTLTLTAM